MACGVGAEALRTAQVYYKSVRGAFRLFRTQAFRIVLIYVVLFAVSVTALLGFTYWITSRTVNAQADQIIEAEIAGLSEQYQRLGWQRWVRLVVSRARPAWWFGHLYPQRWRAPLSGRQSHKLARRHCRSGQLCRVQL